MGFRLEAFGRLRAGWFRLEGVGVPGFRRLVGVGSRVLGVLQVALPSGFLHRAVLGFRGGSGDSRVRRSSAFRFRFEGSLL